MAVNSMVFSQAATLLNALVSQATNQSAIAAINTPEDFVRVAQTALLTGNDPVLNAISQVWNKTIFRVSNAGNPLDSLEMTAEAYGNATRKLSPVAMVAQDDDRYKYPVQYDATQTVPSGNGLAADDMFKLNKQEVLQTNFYGTAVYERIYTIFKDQFECAFSGPNELMQFNAMLLTERNNDKVRFATAAARGLQANFIAALIDENNASRYIHVLTEYNALTGMTTPLTAQTVFQPANFPSFIRWLYSRIATIVELMGESSQDFQTVINAKPILRASRPDQIRVALLSNFMNEIKSMVKSNTYNADMLTLPKYESIPFWQSIDAPDTVDIKPVYTSTAGAVKNATNVVNKAGIIGLIHDKNALGYSFTGSWAAVSPLQIKGGYYNEAQHANLRTISDNTEKAVVLVLD